MTRALASVDANVRAVVNALLAARDLTRDDLARGTGIAPATLKRRMSRSPGPGHVWTAGEVQALSDFLNLPLTAFYAGPDALFAGGTSQGTTSQYVADSAADLVTAA